MSSFLSVNARDGRSLFSGVREPGTVTPRRRSLNSMKYPADSSGFEKRSFGDLKPHERSECSCCICLEEYVDSHVLTKLPCNHWMHSECIEKWFNRDVTCPLCKEIAIEKPYNEVIVPISENTDGLDDSTTSSNRSGSRRPSLSRLIRDTLDQHAEGTLPATEIMLSLSLPLKSKVLLTFPYSFCCCFSFALSSFPSTVYFMYSRNQSSNGFLNFMRNLLQTRRNGQQRNTNSPVQVEDVPIPPAEELQQNVFLQSATNTDSA